MTINKKVFILCVISRKHYEVVLEGGDWPASSPGRFILKEKSNFPKVMKQH